MKFQVQCSGVFGLGLLLFCAGCGETWQTATYPAHGAITINGQPPEGAVVELQSVDEGADVRNSRPWGVVSADGTYSLTTYSTNDGAPVGEYVVTVRWPPTVDRPSLADRLNSAFSTPDESQWQVTIVEGENELPPIAITGAKVAPREKAGARGAPPMGPGMGA